MHRDMQQVWLDPREFHGLEKWVKLRFGSGSATRSRESLGVETVFVDMLAVFHSVLGIPRSDDGQRSRAHAPTLSARATACDRDEHILAEYMEFDRARRSQAATITAAVSERLSAMQLPRGCGGSFEGAIYGPARAIRGRYASVRRQQRRDRTDLHAWLANRLQRVVGQQDQLP